MKNTLNTWAKRKLSSFFLIWLLKISAATQQQATTAIIFLFREVLHINIDDKIQPIKAQKRTSLPVVMSMDEVKQSGSNLLIAQATLWQWFKVNGSYSTSCERP